MADPEVVREVFSQLIVNAIKYTPDGGAINIHGHPLLVGKYDLPEGGLGLD